MEWGEAGNIYYPPNIREIPVELPPSTALAPLSIEPPVITQASLPLPRSPKDLAKLVTKARGLR